MYKIIKWYILILKDKRDELNVYMYMKVVMSVWCSLWLYRIVIWLKCMYNI